jgi:hypothetical protein
MHKFSAASTKVPAGVKTSGANSLPPRWKIGGHTEYVTQFSAIVSGVRKEVKGEA